MGILDRYIFRALLVNYFIAMAVMLCLYVVLDMFVNLDEFTEHGYSTTVVIGNIASYYGPNVFKFFAQLSGVITLFACLVTVAQMRSQLELTAMLACGVSLYRVAAPVVIFGLLSAGLLLVDTEVFIPRVAHLLSREHDDVGGQGAREVLFIADANGSKFFAKKIDAGEGRLEGLHIVLGGRSSFEGLITADSATWEGPDALRASGRWVLSQGIMYEEQDGDSVSSRATVYESDLSPERILARQSEDWVGHLSLQQLSKLQSTPEGNTREVIRAKHARIAAPLVSMVLLLLGLPFFLDRSPESILGDTLKCLLMCGFCYVTVFVAGNIRTDTVSPLPFWVPIFLFGPIATGLIYRVRT